LATSPTEDVDIDVVGALGDGELGGFKSGYLQVYKIHKENKPQI
jgi:hypothetical protein